jgi:sigma-B regulation protein RsbU (phosphoserine phosphatase)
MPIGRSPEERPVPTGAELHETAEELYEEAPCGYLSTLPDGTIVRVNRTFAAWTGYEQHALLGRRFPDLLTAGGRIYHETHYAPLLAMQGEVREIAVELRCADRSRLPVLVNSVLKRGPDGEALFVRTTIFDATARKSYERELMLAHERERDAREAADRAYAQEHDIAQILQRSLLTMPPLDDDRVRFGLHYRPAVAGLAVGGDWYDAFPLGGGRLGVVVGDVVGRGIEAASAMGQLRSGARALATAGVGGPGDVLRHLDRFAGRVPNSTMATLVYAEVDPGAGTACFACAGHPPPLLVAPDGAATVLWDGRSLPLGLTPDALHRAESHVELGPGARLLLYSDGLVERRVESLDTGIDRLVTTIAALGAVAPQVLVDGLADALVRDEAVSDDVCVLCVEVA